MTTIYQTKNWTVKQTSVLTKSLTLSGLFFLAIAAIGYGFGVLFTSYPQESSFLYPISLFLLIGTMFSSVYVMRRVESISKTKILLTMFIYAIAEGIAFGMLFVAFGIKHPENLMLIFGFAGLISLIAGLAGRLMSWKTTMSLSRILVAGSIGVLFVMLFSILFSVFMPQQFSWIFTGVYIAMGFLFIGYIAYDVRLICGMSPFVEMKDANVQMNYVLIFAFKLLMDLIGLIWIIASLFLRFSR